HHVAPRHQTVLVVLDEPVDEIRFELPEWPHPCPPLSIRRRQSGRLVARCGARTMPAGVLDQNTIDRRTWFTRLPDPAGWTTARRSTASQDGRRRPDLAEKNLGIC